MSGLLKEELVFLLCLTHGHVASVGIAYVATKKIIKKCHPHSK